MDTHTSRGVGVLCPKKKTLPNWEGFLPDPGLIFQSLIVGRVSDRRVCPGRAAGDLPGQPRPGVIPVNETLGTISPVCKDVDQLAPRHPFGMGNETPGRDVEDVYHGLSPMVDQKSLQRFVGCLQIEYM